MTETPRNTGRNTPRKTPKKKGKQTAQTQRPATTRVSQRELRKSQREQQKQRMVVKSVAGGLIVALLAIVVGVIYDQMWLPSRPVAQVNNETLTRREYWQEMRTALASELAQSYQMLQFFGDNPQVAEQFAGRGPLVNQQLATLEDDPVNDQLITQWQEQQMLAQGAAELGVNISTDEINQEIAQTMGMAFLPPPEEPAPAAESGETGSMTETDAPTATDELEEPDTTDTTDTTETMTETGTVTDTGTGTGEAALPPTATPIPTPAPDVARQQVPQIVSAIYDQYVNELNAVEMSPALTRDDFEQALHSQARQALLSQKVREQLVPEDTFEPSTEPERVKARHILLRVDVPITDTNTVTETTEAQDAAFDAVLPQAEALVERLNEGADFANLARQESDDPGSREDGGNVGYFNRDGTTESGMTYAPAFVETAFSLDVGEISEPVRTPFGWHIIQVTEEEVLPEEQQLANARDEAFTDWLEAQREAATLKQFPEPEGTPAPTPTPMPTPEPTYVPGPPTPPPTPPVPDELPTTEPVTDTTSTEPVTDTTSTDTTEPVTSTEVITETEPITTTP